MAEVSAIVNACPIVPVSNDPESPEILSPSYLLTQKLECDQFEIGKIDVKDMYKSKWKQVQCLAGQFWARWRKEYLQTLLSRRVWQKEQSPLKVGDIVLLKDLEVSRNSWQ